MNKEAAIPSLPSPSLMAAARILNPLLMAPDKFGTRRRVEEGRIDVRRVYRALQGHRDFRKQVWTQEGFTTAVGLVIDQSGSMRDLIFHAQAAARAILTAVERCGNPSICWGFYQGSLKESGRRHNYKYLGHSKQMAATTPPYVSFDHVTTHAKGTASQHRNFTSDAVRINEGRGSSLIEYKGPYETVAQAHYALGMLNQGATGACTPCSPAIVGCSDLLAEVKADRRVLIVLTDGGCSFGSDYVKDATMYANNIGVETIGVAFNLKGRTPDHIRPGDYNAFEVATVGYTDVSNRAAWNHPVVCEEANELGTAFFSSLIRQLGRGRTKNTRRYL